MNETSSIELLENYSKKHNYDFLNNSDYRKHNLFPSDPVLSTKSCSIIIKSPDKTYYLNFSDSFSTRAYMNSTFCGLYIRGKENIDFQISVRDWMDNLSFKKRYKTWNNNIDENIYITTSAEHIDKYISEDIARELIALNKIVSPIKLISEESNFAHLPGLKDCFTIGLSTNSWITDEFLLDNFIESGLRILSGY